MKILTITNMWPISEYKYYGIFVKEQVEGINKYYPEIENKVLFINGFKNIINYLKSIFQINWHLFFNKYDIIHIHYGLSGLFLLFNPFIRIPVITMLHGTDMDIDKSKKFIVEISKLVAKRSDHIFYLSNKMKNLLKGQIEKLEYLPCGVDTVLFECKRIPNKQNKITIAFPASKQRPEKNYKFFSKIIDTIQFQEKMSIEIIEIHGKSRTEVCSILNSVDILVMTSISEGSPQIIKEAMCCNTPIVTSNVGDVEFLLQGVKNCKVIYEFNVQLFCDAILEILYKDQLTRISSGRERVFELGLDEKSTSQKIFNAYKCLTL